MKLKQLYFDAGEVLFEQGEPCRGAFLIEEGKVEVYRKSGERKVVVAQLGKGEIVGEMALVDHVAHIRNARAMEPTHCLLISPEQYAALVEQTPPIMKLILARVVRKLRRTTDIAFGK